MFGFGTPLPPEGVREHLLLDAGSDRCHRFRWRRDRHDQPATDSWTS